MTTLQTIQKLVKDNAPIFKLYNNYYPSSVEWYLNQVEYIRKGEAPIGPGVSGSQLRAGDAGQYDYLQIPEDKIPIIAKGDLNGAFAYVNVVQLDEPRKGWLDLEYWIFYPYNGPGSARLEVDGSIDINLNVDFKIFGEHEGDWEHITVRMMLKDGNYIPFAVYFAQHNGGIWVDVRNLTREGGRVIVYSSRDGHASFPSAGIFPTATKEFTYKSALLGVRASGFLANYCNGSTDSWDVREKCHIVAVQKVEGVEVAGPDWLPYLGRWGRVRTAAERAVLVGQALGLMKQEVTAVLPAPFDAVKDGIADRIQDAVGNHSTVAEIVPDGPTGLMDKAAWHGEEGDTDALGWNKKVLAPNDAVGKVLDEATRFFQYTDYPGTIYCTSKVAVCNQKAGAARGIIFYYLGDFPDAPLFGRNWKTRVFETMIDYDRMYDDALDFLKQLTLGQSLAAQITMTNLQHGIATLTVWWPQDVNPPAD